MEISSLATEMNCQQQTHSVDAGPLLAYLQHAGDADRHPELWGSQQLLDGVVGHSGRLAGLQPHLLHLIRHAAGAAELHQG